MGKSFPDWVTFYIFFNENDLFFFSTTVVNHPSYIVRGPSQQVKPVVKPPKPPPKIQQLHYCDVCKISCAGRSNFPLWKFAFRLSNFYPTASASKLHELVLNRDQNLREFSVNLISRNTICGNHKILE